MIKRFLLTLVLLVLIGAGSVLIYRGWQNNRIIQQKEEETRQQLIPFQQKKRALLDQMNALQKQYEGKMKETATVQFVCSQLDSALYDDVFPGMLQYAFPGVMVLSPDECPGLPGKITIRQFEEMLRDGWSYCLYWDGRKNLWDAFTDVQWNMPEASITMPDVVYMDAGIYTKEADAVLNSLGIRMVIHHGEEGLPIDITNFESSLWHIGSVSVSGGTARKELKTCVDKRSNLVFDIRFRQDTGEYDVFSLRDLIHAVAFEQREKRVDVTDFAGVKELYQYENENENFRRVRTDDLMAQMDELQKQITELEKQIDAISRGEEYIPSTADEENTSDGVSNDSVLLRSQIERYKEEHPLQITGVATVEIVFSGSYPALYTEVFPQMQLHRASGIIGIRPETLPGMRGCITREQWSDLEKHEWEACLFCDTAEAFSDYCQRMIAACEAEGFPFPHIVWIPEGLYNSSLKEEAEKAGFDIILHHGEETAIVDYPPESGIWTAGCVDWSADGDLSVFDELSLTAGNLAVCIHASESEHLVITSGLASLFEGTAGYIRDGKMTYTNFAAGLDSQEKSRIAREQLNAERNSVLAQMMEKLEAIETRESK